MRADLIINDANLNRLHNKYAPILSKVLSDNEAFTIYKGLMYLEAMGIDIEYKTENKNPGVKIIPTINQVSFFKLADMVALLRLRTQALTHEIYYMNFINRNNAIGEMYFDIFDFQPFRQNLFASGRATSEINIILKDLGFTDDNCSINNYDNVMEFRDDMISVLLVTIGNWINEWEIVQEEKFLYDGLKGIIEQDESSSLFKGGN